MPTPENKVETTKKVVIIPELTKAARKKMTPQEKDARAAFLKAEPTDAKLMRLAKARVTRAVKAIKFVGNLSAYKPNDDQIDKIMEALAGTCAAVEARMRGTKRDAAVFTL